MIRSSQTPSGVSSLKALIKAQEKAQGASLLAAAVTASVVAAAAVVLLGVSGWFITASALAGLAGPLVAKSFNYLIPSAVIRFLAIVRTAARYGERMTGHRAALNALAHLRPEVFASLTRAPVSRSLGLSSGEASSRLIQDVDAIQNHFVRRSAPWGALSALGAGLGMAVIANPAVAGVVLAASLSAIGLCALMGRRFAYPAARRVQIASGQLKSEFAALSAAAPELQAYGARDWASARIAERGADLDQARRDSARANSLMVICQSLCLSLAIAGIIALGPVEAPPLMALALLAAVTTMEGSAALVQALAQAGAVTTAVERLGALMTVDEAEQARALDPDLHVAALNLSLSPPQRLAITGPSGKGKTTLIERLMQLRPVLSGEFELAGHDLSSLSPASARALFAYAPQQAVLMAGTIRSNLKLAAPEATDEALWQALDTADLGDLVRGLPKGLDTRLGENGARLSGGQRRRLGLARAYLRPAPWLVLDEPTEGLDAETEARVLAGLERHLNTRRQGLILVTHRPAPLALCERQIGVTGLDAAGRVVMVEKGQKTPA